MIRRRLAITALALVAAGCVLWWGSGRGQGARGGTEAISRLVPEGTRIRVEVLNATDVRGLARQVMFYLRDAGFDVVYFGNTAERSDLTVIRDRSGHAEWAATAARAMSPARIEAKADSSHFLDLTVLIGSKWSLSRRALHP